ncbi:30S ribosomal protein S3 [Sulfolobales archaeon HS-7]|nr:30S ribosomal protein S3 [Sulfolobales archaeon HS-7]
MVKIKEHFLQKSFTRVKVDEYLATQFYRAGYEGVDIQKTPLGVRVIIRAEKPAMIIGRGGKTIKQLKEILEKDYGLENPQITVIPVEKPELSARVMAFSLATALEKGIHFRRAAFFIIRKIINAGALGAEVIVSGKLTSERARYEKLKEGQVYKTGQQLDVIVDRAIAKAKLTPGIFGVEIVIAKPPSKELGLRFKTEEEMRTSEETGPSASEVVVTNVKFDEGETGNA